MIEAFFLVNQRHAYGFLPCETKAGMKRHTCAGDKLGGLLPSGSFVNRRPVKSSLLPCGLKASLKKFLPL